MDVSTLEDGRENVLSSLMNKYGLEVSKKRRKVLLEVDYKAFESYKAGIEIAHSCKVVLGIICFV